MKVLNPKSELYERMLEIENYLDEHDIQISSNQYLTITFEGKEYTLPVGSPFPRAVEDHFKLVEPI